MKVFVLLLGILVALVSCQEDLGEKENPSLIGEWKLIEVLADPGDGSGTFQAVESDKIIAFHTDSTLTSNGAICDMSIESDNASSGTYSLVDSTISSSACSAYAFKISFEMQGEHLIINYPCIEPCRAKYRKN